MLVCVSLHTLARETAGAARTRLSLRPLAHEGGTNRPNLARKPAARMRRCIPPSSSAKADDPVFQRP